MVRLAFVETALRTLRDLASCSRAARSAAALPSNSSNVSVSVMYETVCSGMATDGGLESGGGEG